LIWRTTKLVAGPVSGVHIGGIVRPDALNRKILAAFDFFKDAPSTRKSHCVAGRFENLYIDRERIPQVEPIIESALAYAAGLLQCQSLKAGFWFNATAPGQATSLHTHDENDELLSGVYYVATPTASGRLMLHCGGERHFVSPCAGRFVLFPPSMPHSVERNTSRQMRLSVGFNIGPHG
jgi:hypothetical protein